MNYLPLVPSCNRKSRVLSAVPLVCVMLFVGALLVGAVPDLGGQDGTARGETSALWGDAGERFESGGRLPDYSFAGYRRGERPLPELEATVNVKQFGATGDGQSDDTAAFQRALLEARGQVIAIPAGHYLINDVLDIRDSGTVLQGAGAQRTVIRVQTPLEQIRSNMGATTEGRPTSNYSWSGGIIWARGRWAQKPLAKVTMAATRGATTLAVDQPEQFETGQEVRLELQDDQQRSLTHHLYAGDPGPIDKLASVKTNWIARIVRVDPAEKRLEFDRPLRTDLRLQWQPVLYSAQSSLEEVGVEHLAIEFPVTPYEGHFTERGYNAIAYSGVRNSWVRDVEIRHADSGIFISGANVSVTGVTYVSDRRRDPGQNSTGHHGIVLGGTDLLLSDFEFRTRFLHDITMTRNSAGNVVRDGRGEDLTFDHHKYANHANLFTNIDAGEGTDIFRSGGGANLGRHCGAWTTWWNIRTRRPIRFPVGWATDMINIVGVNSDQPAEMEAAGRWFEPISPAQLRPSDLYEAQRRRR